MKQGSAIMKGTMKPLRVFDFPEFEARKIRDEYDLSQDKFAMLMGISVATLRSWEQERRKPEGAARVLLRVAATHPEALLDLMENKEPENRPNESLRRTADSRR